MEPTATPIDDGASDAFGPPPRPEPRRRQRTLRDRLDRAAQSIEEARIRTAPAQLSRDDLRWAVRDLAAALDDVAKVLRVLHIEGMEQLDFVDR